MREIEEMSSDDDGDADGGGDDDDDDDDDGRGKVGKKRSANAGGRGAVASKKAAGRAAGGSSFASADEFGAKVDEWHAQLVKVFPAPLLLIDKLSRSQSPPPPECFAGQS